MLLTEATLKRLWPHVDAAKPGLIAAVAASSRRVFAKYNLDNPTVVAHAMAQFSHEFGAGNSGHSIEFEENLSYTAARICAVWPSRFHNASEAAPFAHNPRALGSKVYNGRMGNMPGTEDGYNFRGRGGSQVTGREGYKKLADKTGLPLLTQPDLVNSPEHFLECAVADFVLCGCLPYAQQDNVDKVTLRLNGGKIGLSERKAWLAKWKAALRAAPAPSQEPEEAPTDPQEPTGGPKGMGWSKTGWSAIAATVTTVCTAVGQAMDSLRPILESPTTVALLVVVAVGLGGFIWWDRRQKMYKHGI